MLREKQIETLCDLVTGAGSNFHKNPSSMILRMNKLKLAPSEYNVLKKVMETLNEEVVIKKKKKSKAPTLSINERFHRAIISWACEAAKRQESKLKENLSLNFTIHTLDEYLKFDDHVLSTKLQELTMSKKATNKIDLVITEELGTLFFSFWKKSKKDKTAFAKFMLANGYAVTTGYRYIAIREIIRALPGLKDTSATGSSIDQYKKQFRAEIEKLRNSKPVFDAIKVLSHASHGSTITITKNVINVDAAETNNALGWEIPMTSNEPWMVSAGADSVIYDEFADEKSESPGIAIGRLFSSCKTWKEYMTTQSEYYECLRWIDAFDEMKQTKTCSFRFDEISAIPKKELTKVIKDYNIKITKVMDKFAELTQSLSDEYNEAWKKSGLGEKNDDDDDEDEDDEDEDEDEDDIHDSDFDLLDSDEDEPTDSTPTKSTAKTTSETTSETTSANVNKKNDSTPTKSTAKTTSETTSETTLANVNKKNQKKLPKVTKKSSTQSLDDSLDSLTVNEFMNVD